MSELRKYREANNLDLKGMADLLGVSTATISRWENGHRHVNGPLLARVSAVTGIPRHALRPDLYPADDASGALNPRP